MKGSKEGLAMKKVDVQMYRWKKVEDEKKKQEVRNEINFDTIRSLFVYAVLDYVRLRRLLIYTTPRT